MNFARQRKVFSWFGKIEGKLAAIRREKIEQFIQIVGRSLNLLHVLSAEVSKLLDWDRHLLNFNKVFVRFALSSAFERLKFSLKTQQKTSINWRQTFYIIWRSLNPQKTRKFSRKSNKISVFHLHIYVSTRISKLKTSISETFPTASLAFSFHHFQLTSPTANSTRKTNFQTWKFSKFSTKYL
jgi:hypothetical protein